LDTKALCLAALSLGDASGYEIKKRFEEVFSRFLDVSPSGIYAALKQLDQDGLVSSVHVPQEGRPNKTTYALLPAGREVLVESLKASDGRHRIRSELVTLLMFADLLPPEKIRAVFANRVAELEKVRRELGATGCALDADRCPGSPGHRFLAGLGTAMVEAELAYLRDNLPSFLSELGSGHNRETRIAEPIG